MSSFGVRFRGQDISEESVFLCHHGVKGQKWGVRRYQNEDGTLTDAGRKRYGDSEDRGDKGAIKKWTMGSEGGKYAFAKWRERRHDKNLSKVQSKYDKKIAEQKQAAKDLRKQADESPYLSDKQREFMNGVAVDTDARVNKLQEKKEKKLQKYESKKAAQSAANANLDAYRRHHDTAELVMQNYLMSMVGGSAYRHARARGESQLSSFAEAFLPVGPIMRMSRDKKAYGKYIVFSDTSGDEYYADEARSR